MGCSEAPSSSDLLTGLFDDEIRVASAAIEDRTDSLLPEELAGVGHASLARRAEFSTGRWLARHLLRELGDSSAPIVRGEDRLPHWPAGWLGSISHSGPICAAAVASAARYRALGIDLEPDEPVKPGLARMICFGPELAWIADDDELEARRRCRMIFSAKEAVYKAFYPLTRRVWNFEDVAVSFDLRADAFRARLPPDAGLAEIGGRILRRGGWIVSGVAWAASAPPGRIDPR